MKLRRFFMAAGAAFVLSNPASALTVNLGDTVDINSCTNGDPCVLSGEPLRDFFNFGTFDLFHATFNGTANAFVDWVLTPLVDLEVTTSGVGGVPIDANAGGGSSSILLAAGTTTTQTFQFDTAGLLTLNLVTQGNAVADAAGFFSESGFAFDAGSGLFGLPSAGSGGNGNGSGDLDPVPLPASALLLLGGLAGFGIFQRKSEKTS